MIGLGNWKTSATHMLVIAIAAGAGWLASGALIPVTHEASSSSPPSTLNSPEIKVLLERKLDGLHKGDELPEVPLWTIDGGDPVLLADLLAGGGGFILIRPRCTACLDALADLANRTNQVALPIVVIIDDPAGIDAWRESDIAARIRLPVYCDWEGRLTRDHHVLASMGWFRVDRDGRVSDFDLTLEPRSLDWERLLTE
ncbi:MAG: hypothetical protein AB1752_12350 [Candidatus Zixiibacteriota bacterium]